MDLHERIIKYIENHNPISYTRILNVAQGKGFNELQVLTALEKVHKNKSITTKNRKDEIWYYLTPPLKTPTVGSHLKWLRDNYPAMDETNDGSGLDIGDMSWMFLKTKEERDEFHANMKGNGYQKVRRRYST